MSIQGLRSISEPAAFAASVPTGLDYRRKRLESQENTLRNEYIQRILQESFRRQILREPRIWVSRVARPFSTI